MSEVKKYLKTLDRLTSSKKTSSHKNDWYYNGIWDFLLREGDVYDSQELTKEESEKVSELIDRFTFLFGEPKPKQCYYNSQMAATMNDEFTYVEGYALCSLGLPLPHAFLVINNKVVDLTWRNDNTNDIIKGKHSLEYLGVPFHIKDIRQACIDTSMAQSHLECYWNKGALFKKKFIKGEPYYVK
tara:strand:- start:1118 stop:1672 length:555 start_codon:yes stop_codon:yes gene_type:complete